jgi:hypothetical protein
MVATDYYHGTCCISCIHQTSNWFHAQHCYDIVIKCYKHPEWDMLTCFNSCDDFIMDKGDNE